MTQSSIRLAIALIFSLLSISITNTASAASNKKCFQTWANGYDKKSSIAITKAAGVWTAQARAALKTSRVWWRKSSNRQVKIKTVDHNGQITRQASVYGKYCRYVHPGSSRNSAAPQRPNIPSLRYRLHGSVYTLLNLLAYGD